MDVLQLLKDLSAAPGLSAYEAPVRKLIRQAWESLADEMNEDKVGNLWATKSGRGAAPRKKIMLAAHMDAIGLMVSQIEQGFLRITEIGGIDPRVLPGQLVTVHGREPVPGVIVQPPAALLPSENADGVIPLAKLLVDTGLPAERVKQLVRVGDTVSFAQPPLELHGGIMGGKSLDNRASLVALTVCLQELQTRSHQWDVIAVATVQEEETMLGARASAYNLRPDIAVAVDVTFASGPGLPDNKTFDLGGGPTIGWGPNIHPKLYQALSAAATRSEIPTKMEPLPQHSGTDAYAIQIAGQGIPAVVLSIPLKHMHTPVELVSVKDIHRAGRLLAEFIVGLNSEFMATLKWED